MTSCVVLLVCMWFCGSTHPLKGLQLGSITYPLILAVTYAIAREGPRRGCLRARTAAAAASSARAAQLATLPATLLLPAALLAWSRGQQAAITPADYWRAGALFSTAVVIEMAAEPWYVAMTHCGHVGAESATEVLARLADAVAFWASLCVQKVQCSQAVHS